jgi:hypothetical protein
VAVFIGTEVGRKRAKIEVGLAVKLLVEEKN